MTYQDQIEQTVTATAAQVAAAVALYEAGKITAETLAGLVAAFVAAGNSRAAALADLSLASALTVKAGTVVPRSASSARSTTPTGSRRPRRRS